MRIRPATLADAAAIAQVHVQSWHETYRGLVPDEMLATLSVSHNTHMWRDILADPGTTVLVAEQPSGTTVANMRGADAGTIVGFGSAGPNRDKALGADGEVTALYILDAIKRRGTGRALFTRLMRALATHGHRRAGAWVLSANQNARRFYEAMGGTSGATRDVVHSTALLPEVAYVWEDIGL